MLDEYKAGINCRNGSVEDVAYAIVTLFKNKGMREKMAAASRRLAEEKFNRAVSYKCLFEVIEK